MNGAVRARLGPACWHFQHGPIDLVIGADGDAVGGLTHELVERAVLNAGKPDLQIGNFRKNTTTRQP